MSAAWVKEVAAAHIENSKHYFLARKISAHMYMYLSENKAGKQVWSEKPGIARHLHGEQLRSVLDKNPEYVALEIPKDHAKRWKRR